jgi:AraC family transcriptional regulator of adaptative response/methylated-DNA-[protein]-cysteine methyltransferase
MTATLNETAARWVAEIPTPIGAMTAVADDAGILRLDFVGQPSAAIAQRLGAEQAMPGDNAHLDRLREELTEYFAGSRRDFTVLLAPAGGTAFQQAVWAFLRTIPFGQTRTYAQQARAIGSAQAARAVGQANGCNPVSIIVPCHRVIGATGSLTGFGGGIERKRWLLEHERRVSGLWG